jgi:hypothetical protein
MSAEEVLTTFRRDAPYLFLGAAFAAVGMVSAAFAVLRRQRDSLLICFALFAALYGLRLWISSPILVMIAQSATFYARLRGASTRAVRICRISQHCGLCCRQKYSAAGSTVEGDPKGIRGSPSYSVINSARRISPSTNFRVAARHRPMTSVAGDLYDYIIADDHQVGLLIAAV